MNRFADTHVHMSDISFEKCKNYLDTLASLGLTDIAIQSLTYRSVVYNLSALYWKEHYKKLNISVFGMVHIEDFYRKVPYEVQAKALLDMGCDGIKYMYAPDTRKKMDHSVSDERYEKMFAYLEENEIPVLMHVNDPDSFWVVRELTPYEIERNWGYFLEGYKTKQEIYDEVFEMLDRHPKLHITFAHFFFLYEHYDEAVRVMEKYPNVCFDLTPCWEIFKFFSERLDDWRAFFEKYSHRLLFGTDSNSTKNNNEVLNWLVLTAITHDTSEFKVPFAKDAYIRGLDLSKEAVENICFNNHQRFVGDPKPVDMEAVRRAAQQVEMDIAGMEDEKMKVAFSWLQEFKTK